MNRLAKCISPYLLQHADNPVHWQPWDDAALSQAAAEDKPILLSVGYAACHWCHVMEEESFVCEKTAATMNANFVCIKVDREERPDIDRIYQSAHYLFTQRGGGWPLTMFLTPAGEPFFGGTYFPKTARHGLPSFCEVMQRAAAAWRDKRKDILSQNEKLIPLLRSLDDYKTGDSRLDGAPIKAAAKIFSGLFDDANGGFRGAPKFPHAAEINFCLTAARQNDDAILSQKIKNTLQKMAAGGLQDHLGGGFFRYSVDEYWAIPHFEKMLCDNALLLSLYAEAARVFGEPVFANTAADIAQWGMDEMRDSAGAFYSSLDADSQGGEGLFYVWEKNEIEKLLDKSEYDSFESHFGLSAGCNFENRYWHLARRQTVLQTATLLALPPVLCEQKINSARRKLFAQRAERIRPPTDDKVLTAWNALFIGGLARAGRLLAREDWTAAAADALMFIRGNLMVDGKLRAVWRRGECGGGAFLDDYAFLLAACLEVLRAEFNSDTLTFAQTIAAQMRARFADEKGGFFFTASDGEKLIRRPMSIDDNATPSGNGVAVQSLLRLSWLTGDASLAATAEKSLKVFYDSIQQRPAGCASLLLALGDYLQPPPMIFLTGEAVECARWRRWLAEESARKQDIWVFILPPDTSGLPLVLQKPRPPKTGAAAYICNAFSCQPPATDFAELKNRLR